MTQTEFDHGLQLRLWRCELQYRAENLPHGSSVDWLAPYCYSVNEIARFLRELGFRIKEVSEYTDPSTGEKFNWVITNGGIIVYENSGDSRGFVAMSIQERQRRASKGKRL